MSREAKFFGVLASCPGHDWEVYAWEVGSSTTAHMIARKCAKEYPGTKFFIADIVGYHEAPVPSPVFVAFDQPAPLLLRGLTEAELTELPQ